MQANAINEHELVKCCMEELCKKAGFADTHGLVQRDLEFLCTGIEAKTGILISLSTIKRLLNGQFSRMPQIATLNAIAMYLGYTSWQQFKVHKMESDKSHENDMITAANSFVGNITHPTHPNLRSHKFSRVYYWLGLCLLVVAALGLLAALKHKSSQPGNYGKARFAAIKTTGNDIPNTVIFKYNVDSVNADSFFIQQSWDKNRRVRVYKNNYTLTDIYYEPGYHTAKLIANDKIIKTQDVSIPTDRWFFYAKDWVPASQPKYVTTQGMKDGCLQMTKAEVLNSQVDIEKQNQYVNVYFPSKIEHSSDNFDLKCRVKVNQLKNSVCPYLMCEVFCQRHFMYFVSMPKGCASEMRAQFGENELSGKTTDFSRLGFDATQWQDVEFMVKNRQVTIRVNNQDVFTASYHDSSGLITGLGFISNGLCQVDFVDFKTLGGKNIYSNDFGK